ncbi:MAG: sugar ABC transporter permease [Clostridia bacterium]|nr:sugar ABC transporter permease [Clostridia bacterium]
MKQKKYIILLLPSFMGIIVLYIIPFIYVIYYSLVNNAFTNKFVGFDNYISVWNNEYFRLALKNTGRFMLTAVPLIMLYSIILSLAIAYLSRWLRFLKSAFFLSIVLPSSAITLVWNLYFSQCPPFESLLVIYLWKYSGFTIMILTTALARMDAAQQEAAQIDGAGIFRRTFYITLPNIIPALLFSFILSIVSAFKIYRESYLLYGYYPDDSVYMLQNYLNNHFMKLNYQNISTAALSFSVLLYVIIAAVLLLEKKWRDSVE